MRIIALTAETEAARQSPRSGTATIFDAASMRPTPVHTTDGTTGWQVDLGGGRPLATPAVVDGVVYVGGGFGSREFYALDAHTGASRWAVRVSDDGPTAAVVSDGVVAFNTESCTLFVVDARTGQTLWSRWLGDPLMSQPSILDGRLFMAFPGGGGHRLVAFELRTGRELWRVPIAGDIVSAPVAYGDSVFATTFDGTVYRVRAADGGLVWQEAYRATSAPWLYGDQVYVSHREAPQASLGFGAHALLAQTVNTSPHPVESVGRIDTSSGSGSSAGWNARPAPWLDPGVQRRSGYRTSQGQQDTSVGFATAPATAGVTAAESNVGQNTVQGLWEYQGSRPCVVGGRLFLTQGDQLVALDVDSGARLWSVAITGVLASDGGHLASPPSAAGGKLYLAGVRGDIVVVDQQDGHVERTIHTGAPMRFQPAIAGGMVFVGAANGRVMGLDLHDATADGWTMWGGSAAHNGR